MTELDYHLARLTSAALEWGAPSWDKVVLVEESDISYGPKGEASTTTFRSSEVYAARFSEHLEQGFGWINLNASCILDGVLFVIVELPEYLEDTPIGKVPVNFSGPPLIDGKPQWSSELHFKFVEKTTVKRISEQTEIDDYVFPTT